MVQSQDNNVKEILFVHGITSSGKTREALAIFLSTYGYNLHCFDLPGHGVFSKQKNIGKLRFNHMLLAIDKYIEEHLKDQPFILYGHSMGGGLCQAIFPKYINQIKGVILECPLSKAAVKWADKKEEKKPEEITTNEKTKGKKGNIFKELIDSGRKYMDVFAGYSKSTYEAIAHFIREDYKYTSLLMNIIGAPSIAAIESGSKQINVPTLLVLGGQDQIIPALPTAEYFRSNISNLTVKTIADALHTPSTQFPELFNQTILEFLDTQINKK